MTVYPSCMFTGPLNVLALAAAMVVVVASCMFPYIQVSAEKRTRESDGIKWNRME